MVVSVQALQRRGQSEARESIIFLCFVSQPHAQSRKPEPGQFALFWLFSTQSDARTLLTLTQCEQVAYQISIFTESHSASVIVELLAVVEDAGERGFQDALSIHVDVASVIVAHATLVFPKICLCITRAKGSSKHSGDERKDRHTREHLLAALF